MMFNRLPFVLGLLLVLPLFSALATDNQACVGAPPTPDYIASPVPPAPAGTVDAALIGKPWRLKELISEPLPLEEGAPYLLFTRAGDLLGFGGCNYFLGRYRTTDTGKLIVSSLRATPQRCPETSERETTLLTSLLLANSLQLGDDGVTFFMDGNSLLKLGEAPDLPVDELLQHGKLLKAKKSRKHKTRGKKIKSPSKAKKSGKKPATKAPGKELRETAKPAPKQ